MESIVLEADTAPSVGAAPFELVERKGIGHPDTLCDAVMEAVSVRLSQRYLEETGGICHYNLDKALWVAGQTSPRLGGGTVEQPMRLVVGDRAVLEIDGRDLAISDLVEDTVVTWLRQHLRYVDPAKHLIIQNELRPGSAELSGIYTSDRAGMHRANDTSVGVGFAPLTETECLVLAAEHLLNDRGFKHEFPETGEDVKVMGLRYGRRLHLTVAMAFVDHHLWEPATYFHRKEAVVRRLQAHLESKQHALDEISIELNTLDDAARGADGMYLTVLGTSAESADGGEVGRGNRIHGLISPMRPMTLEAAAGKNPVSHVGKIYQVLARQIAELLVVRLEEIEEAAVWLCSQIGRPIDQPWVTGVRLKLAKGAGLPDVNRRVKDLIRQEFAELDALLEQIVQGRIRLW